ncbi:MAG: hypothetical protein HKN60_02950 [Rhizobiales bacterium]|nr:hypothetical protein [Hyphomicrobiales bacterium]
MEIGAKATDVFGSPRVDSVFFNGQSAPPSPQQETARVSIIAQKREINRIHGYKLQLTPAESKRLSEIQADVIDIERKASAGTVRDDELDDRIELLAEADEIIGKPVVDVEADDTLAEFAQAVESLLEPKLDPRKLAQVERLERVKATIEGNLNANPESPTLLSQFQSVSALIDGLTPPRPVSALSNSERELYDDLTELINDHTGVKLQLNSKEAIRVAELEKSILQLQEILPPDISQQPTPQAVARAYTRLF